MATIKDVAQRAGVSVATVSRVLNKPDAVRERTRALVQTAIGELGYRPNFLGKSLRRLETRRILVVMDNISNQFYSRVFRGVEDTARNHDYSVTIATTRGHRKHMLESAALVQSKVVDGAIFLTTQNGEAEISELNRYTPVVCACEPAHDPAISWVAIDNIRAAYDATTYLLEHGKRRIGCVCPNPAASSRLSGSFARRESGFRKAHIDFGVKIDPSLIMQEGLTYKAGMRAACRMMSLDQLPDAVFAFSDAAAIGLISALAGQGVRVPDDISVLGFDNTAVSEVFLPSLSTVGQPQYDIGRLAMELLVCRLGGGTPESIIVPHQIIERDSVIHHTNRITE